MKRLTVLLFASSCYTDIIDHVPSDEPLANGSATVVVEIAGAPAPGIDVVFSGPTGGLAHHAITDELGEASAEIMSGAMVTAAWFDSGLDRFDVITTAGIEPGDRVQIELGPESPWHDVTTAAIVFSPFVDPNGESAQAYFISGCESAQVFDPAEIQILTIDRDCLEDDGTFTVRVIAELNANLVAHTMSTGIVPLTPGPMEVVLPPWRTDFDEITVDAVNPPSEVFFVGVARPDEVNNPVDTFPATLLVPAEGDQIEVLALASSPEGENHNWMSRPRARTDTVIVDGNDLLPFVRNLTYSETYAFEYELSREPVAADGISAEAFAYTSEGVEIRWQLVAPANRGPIAFPELPPALIALDPTTAVRGSRQSLALVDHADFAGWSDVRVAPSAFIRRSEKSERLSTQRIGY
jgi:hypothetical protein